VSEAKKVLEQAIERWNATDRDGWAALYTDDVVYEAPGVASASKYFSFSSANPEIRAPAAPDRRSSEVVLFAEGDHVVEQARYTGTHTGTWRNSDGAEIPATGNKVDLTFVGVFRVENGKISSIRLYYDQIEVFAQLGLMPGATSS
jgi:ketosteroid isomerase-like protein